MMDNHAYHSPPEESMATRQAGWDNVVELPAAGARRAAGGVAHSVKVSTEYVLHMP